MQLSERLHAVACMVSEGKVLVDVGTDHGYLPIFLIENRKIPRAIAVDVCKGPLERAKENIAVHGLGEYIETRLSNGLEKISPGEVQTVVLAGMGGPLMVDILTAGSPVMDQVEEIILQPQSDVPQVRRFIESRGFSITDETMVLEEGKFYPVMKAVPGQREIREEVFYLYGEMLLKKKSPVLKQYLEKEKQQKVRLIQTLKAKDTDNTRFRSNELQEEMQYIQTALEYYEDK